MNRVGPARASNKILVRIHHLFCPADGWWFNKLYTTNSCCLYDPFTLLLHGQNKKKMINDLITRAIIVEAFERDLSNMQLIVTVIYYFHAHPYVHLYNVHTPYHPIQPLHPRVKIKTSESCRILL